MASHCPSPSPKAIAVESDSSKLIPIGSNMEHSQAPNNQSRAVHCPVAILWDIENCPIPSDVRPEDVSGNIRMALRVHPVVGGAVTMFSAYGDFNAFPRRLREGCQRTGVKLVDVPNGRKDAADKAILVDMFLFALDNRPPSSIMLISGDVDFAPALHILGQRGYTVILVIPSGVRVSSALSNAGRFVWDWPSVARGEGFVPPKAVMPYADNQNEEEIITYRGISQNEYGTTRGSVNQVYHCNLSYSSRELSRASEYSNSCSNFILEPYFNSSRSHSLPSGVSEGLMGGDQNSTQEHSWWVRPGDVQGLKGQFIRLLEMSGGSLPLVRVPSEYLKVFGRPLYMAEYGVYKLVNLIKKMTDALIVVGKGHKKMLCLRNTDDRQNIKKCPCPSTPIILKREEKKGKSVVVEENSESSTDEFSDDERNNATYEINDHLESFKQEVQELLVCYSCPVPISALESLYEQRYKKALDYQSFGVDGLEELIEKLRDVVELREDRVSKRKFLASCG
ncbi:hypothetical protein ACMD2_25017 [Ananas comosus]|uniref:HTH OST-type domain-containing protein n=1 Tax=Ananas comosus TaxID=4615 RepID=A0A199URS4_ANACO|nr:hypothetical protein ACMD2_25017 [Ananas comosus]